MQSAVAFETVIFCGIDLDGMNLDLDAENQSSFAGKRMKPCS